MRARQKLTPEFLVSLMFRGVTSIAAFAIFGILAIIAFLLLREAGPSFQEFGFKFLVSGDWNPVESRESYGILTAVYGTLASSLIALLFAVPLGVGTAILLSEDILPRRINTLLGLLVELLAAIPSVVYGLWGIFVLIPIVDHFGGIIHQKLGWIPFFGSDPVGPGLITASLVLGIMVIPIITAISRDALNAVPISRKMASYALGADRWLTVFKVSIPNAARGITGGIALGLGRALGETMAVTMLIGNSNRISLSVFDPTRTIASLIANQFAEAEGLQVSALMYAGVVLLGITLVTNIVAELIVSQVATE